MTAVLTAPYDYAAQPKETLGGCPVCAMPNESRRAIDRYGFEIGLSVCATCGLLYLNPRLTAEGYAAFYRGTYRDLLRAWTKRSRLSSPLSMEAHGLARGHMVGAFLQSAHITATRIVDVGGSIGAFAQALTKVLACPDVTIIDPNPDELSQAALRGFATQCGMVEALPPSTCTYDLILCVEVADHWRDPIAALHWMRNALAPGGHLWIDILNTPEVCKTWPLSVWKIDHPLYWTHHSFSEALQRTGWCITARVSQEGSLRARHLSYLCSGA